MIAATPTGSINFPHTHSEHFFDDVALYGDFDMCVDLQEAFGYILWNFTVSVWSFTVSDGNFVFSDPVATMLPLDWRCYVFLSLE